MKKKILSTLVIVSLAITTLMGCGNDNISQQDTEGYQQIELIMAVNGTDIQIDTLVAKKFSELVAEESNGNIEIIVFPNDQLAGGNATKGIEMIADV